MPKNIDHDSVRIISALEDSSLVFGLAPEKIARIEKIAVLQRYEVGEYIITEDRRSRDLFVICDGQISIRALNPMVVAREEEILRRSGVDIFGEFAFVDGQSRTASVLADTPTVAIRLGYETFTDLMEKDPVIGYRINQNLSSLISSRFREISDVLKRFRELFLIIDRLPGSSGDA